MSALRKNSYEKNMTTKLSVECCQVFTKMSNEHLDNLIYSVENEELVHFCFGDKYTIGVIKVASSYE